MKYIIGIDGGGTKTDGVLCDLNGNVLNRVVLEQSNPIDVGIAKSVDVLLKTVNTLCPDTNKLAGVFAGIAGGISGDNKRLIYERLRENLPEESQIDNNSDAVCALNSGVNTGDGGVVISGTGCVGYYRKNGEIIRVGGYGYLIDRGGSGYDFGRDALYYSLCDIDGRGEKTVLTEMLENKTNGIIKNLDTIYKKGKRYIASFAPIVFDAYKVGDSVAKKILDNNAKEYAKIFNCLGSISEDDKCSIVLAGGMWNNYDIIIKHTEKYIDRNIKFILPDVPPVYGAVIEAARNVGVINDKFIFNLREKIKL